MAVNLLQDIQRRQALEIKISISFQDIVVKTLAVEANHAIQGLKAFDQFRNLFLQILDAAVLYRIVQNAATDLHKIGPVPPADLLGRALGFKIENTVVGCCRFHRGYRPDDGFCLFDSLPSFAGVPPLSQAAA